MTKKIAQDLSPQPLLSRGARIWNVLEQRWVDYGPTYVPDDVWATMSEADRGIARQYGLRPGREP